MRAQCAADPCKFANDDTCDVPEYCTEGDYVDCATAGNPVITGTLPREIGVLSCRSKITDVYAAVPPAAPADAANQPCHPHEDHCRCRVFSGYPGLVGALPATLSALTAVSRMCAPAHPKCPMRAPPARIP
jgi:hypothetical protein